MISKSKYLLGLQCPKLLWVAANDKERLSPPDEGTLHRFSQGHLIGGLAKKLFPGGVDIPEDFGSNLAMTKVLLERKQTLFEAGIMADGLYSRADVLRPSGDGWDVIEVKSSTSVKDVNIHDLAFQRFVYEKAGLKIDRCILMHIDNTYVRDGELDPKRLFVQEDVTSEVDHASSGIKERIQRMSEVLGGSEPVVDIGKHCNNPYACALYDECWGFLPENGVHTLCCAGKRCFDLIDRGVLCIKDIPDDYKLTSRQDIQRECELSGKPHIDREEISRWLGELKYPLYFFDFETFGTAVPLFSGVRPYQQIPFQFSLHVQKDGKLEHYSFLAEGQDDPRPELLKKMKGWIGDSGHIIAYSKSFEIARLKECAEAFPEYSEWIESIIPRFVDLMIPFSKFWYYDPMQKGSASIKKVLPAVVGKSYDGMEIGDGGTASIEYLRVTFGECPQEEIDKVRGNLEKYCCLDTEGMVWILDGLKEKMSN